MRLASLVLAGGRSRRMGQPKEALPVGSDTLLGHVVARLSPRTAPVVVVARGRDQVLPPLPAHVHTLLDTVPDLGPLAAIALGLRHLEAHGADAAFVTGCDAPFAGAEVASWLAARLGDHDLVLPRRDGIPQPLCAVYRVSARTAIERALADGATSPRSLPERVRTRWVDEPELRELDPELRCLCDVDTPGDWLAARRELVLPPD